MEAASVRYKNPGAMWGNKLAKRWGATQAVALNDGLGQGNNIADFPTAVQGACAQFDLWRTSYCNLSLRQAITKWSGGNSSTAYMKFLCEQTGLGADTLITQNILAGPQGRLLMKAQAQWEAGKPYPLLTEADWVVAQQKVFNPSVSKSAKQTAAAGTVIVATTTAAHQAASQGHSWGFVVAIILGGLGLGALLFLAIHHFHKGA